MSDRAYSSRRDRVGSVERRQGQRRSAAERAQQWIALQRVSQLDQWAELEEQGHFRGEMDIPVMNTSELRANDVWNGARATVKQRVLDKMTEIEDGPGYQVAMRWLKVRTSEDSCARMVHMVPKRFEEDESGELRLVAEDKYTDKCKSDTTLCCFFCCDSPKLAQYCNDCHQFVGCRKCVLRWYCAEDAFEGASDLAVLVDTVEMRSSHRRCPLCNHPWTHCPNTRPTFHRSLANGKVPSSYKRRPGQRHRLLSMVVVKDDVIEWQNIFDKVGSGKKEPRNANS